MEDLDSQRPLYVIVHEKCFQNPFFRDRTDLPVVVQELERIKREEEYYVVDDSEDPLEIPKGLPNDNRPILVCGAYLELCVKSQVWILELAGRDVSIYRPGTFSLLG